MDKACRSQQTAKELNHASGINEILRCPDRRSAIDRGKNSGPATFQNTPDNDAHFVEQAHRHRQHEL